MMCRWNGKMTSHILTRIRILSVGNYCLQWFVGSTRKRLTCRVPLISVPKHFDWLEIGLTKTMHPNNTFGGPEVITKHLITQITSLNSLAKSAITAAPIGRVWKKCLIKNLFTHGLIKRISNGTTNGKPKPFAPTLTLLKLSNATI